MLRNKKALQAIPWALRPQMAGASSSSSDEEEELTDDDEGSGEEVDLNAPGPEGLVETDADAPRQSRKGTDDHGRRRAVARKRSLRKIRTTAQNATRMAMDVRVLARFSIAGHPRHLCALPPSLAPVPCPPARVAPPRNLGVQSVRRAASIAPHLHPRITRTPFISDQVPIYGAFDLHLWLGGARLASERIQLLEPSEETGAKLAEARERKRAAEEQAREDWLRSLPTWQRNFEISWKQASEGLRARMGCAMIRSRPRRSDAACTLVVRRAHARRARAGSTWARRARRRSPRCTRCCCGR